MRSTWFEIKTYLDLVERSILHNTHDKEYYRNEELRSRREVGKENPHDMMVTMIGAQRLRNVRYCCEEAIEGGVYGDFIEAGVWRGGAALMMRAVANIYRSNRNVWVCDSFCGLPQPDGVKYPKDAGCNLWTSDELRVPVEEVRALFERYDLLDKSVHFVEGFFCDTLHKVPVDEISVLRLDGDMYQSTMETLEVLYPKLARGGFCIVDDYNCLEQCRTAVQDYMGKVGQSFDPQQVDWTGVYWRKQ